MEAVALALASNERYFPGLYCAVASALNELDSARRVNLKVLDGGISQTSKETLWRLVERLRKSAQLEFVRVDLSMFKRATLGPGQSHMTYSRILLPELLNLSRVIYLDSDVLVFRDLSELFDLELSPSKVLAAVPDSETLSFAQDSSVIADAMRSQAGAAYFNCGVMLMNLDELRRQSFFQRSLEFLNKWSGHYQFWDQSVINFLLQQQIAGLPECWNRPSWRFDAQQDNQLQCVLHYTTYAPWFGGPTTPGQALFERFAEEAALPVDRQSSEFKKSARRNFWRNAFAPLRALVFPVWSFLYGVVGEKQKAAAYNRVARYWLDYICSTPSRWQLHRRRTQEILKMRFDLRTSRVAS